MQRKKRRIGITKHAKCSVFFVECLAIIMKIVICNLGAIFMLVSDWRSNRGRKCDFNSSIDSLATKWYPHNQYPIILMEIKPWKRDNTIAIKHQWPELDFKFRRSSSLNAAVEQTINNPYPISITTSECFISSSVGL